MVNRDDARSVSVRRSSVLGMLGEDLPEFLALSVGGVLDVDSAALCDNIGGAVWANDLCKAGVLKKWSRRSIMMMIKTVTERTFHHFSTAATSAAKRAFSLAIWDDSCWVVVVVGI